MKFVLALLNVMLGIGIMWFLAYCFGPVTLLFSWIIAIVVMNYFGTHIEKIKD